MKMRIMFTPRTHSSQRFVRSYEICHGGKERKEEKKRGSCLKIKACEAEKIKKWIRRFFSRGYFYLIQTCRRQNICGGDEEMRRKISLAVTKMKAMEKENFFVIPSIKELQEKQSKGYQESEERFI